MERDRLDYISIDALISICITALLLCIMLGYLFENIHLEKGVWLSQGAYIGFAISWLILTIVKIVRYLKYKKGN